MLAAKSVNIGKIQVTNSLGCFGVSQGPAENRLTEIGNSLANMYKALVKKQSVQRKSCPIPRG